jgi:hypothetical protein
MEMDRETKDERRIMKRQRKIKIKITAAKIKL